MTLTIREMPAIDRPREKMRRHGEAKLTNEELLQVLLGSGMPGYDVTRIAHQVDELMIRSDGHPKLDELLGVRGVGEATALKLLACLELVERRIKTGRRVVCEEDVLPMLDDIRHRNQEHFMVITLDGANRVIARRVVTVGTINASLVHPREVFADAISDRAASIVVAHNHPGGTLEPSAADIEVTRRLRDAGKLLGIQLFDHIIVTSDSSMTIGV